MIAACLILCTGIHAGELSPEGYISLLTCTPGTEVYTRYGHTALRVVDEKNDIDLTFNYGSFNFDTEHFYWKFLKGETWYELDVSPTWWFMRECKQLRRTVYEQRLNLTPAQREELWQALVTNYLPENRSYLYNFVFDNCATRPYILISNIFNDSISSDYIGHTGVTYRAFLRHYSGEMSWVNAGINLIFGAKADQPMRSDQRLFLPEELMWYIEAARMPNGTPLVSESHIAPFTIDPTPWYASWPFGLAIFFVLICLISWYDRCRNRWSWWVEIAVSVPYGLLLLLVAFLTLFSIHPFIGFGWRLLIIPLTHLCARLIFIFR